MGASKLLPVVDHELASLYTSDDLHYGHNLYETTEQAKSTNLSVAPTIWRMCKTGTTLLFGSHVVSQSSRQPVLNEYALERRPREQIPASEVVDTRTDDDSDVVEVIIDTFGVIYGEAMLVRARINDIHDDLDVVNIARTERYPSAPQMLNEPQHYFYICLGWL